MQNKTKVILALGSNDSQENSIVKAKKRLETLFDDIRFSPAIWTKPIGIVSADFLNCMAVATTQTDYSQIRASLKEIERDCGDSRYLRNQHIVKMDIDVLLFGKQKMHEKDWERPYIKQLMSILSE